MWRGSALPTECQGIKVLGCLLGHDDLVHAHLERERTHQAHRTLLQRIPGVPDVQSAWALLLHCASARANYSLRVVRPELVAQFAAAHDAGLWRCLCDTVNVAPDQCSAGARDAATLPSSLGGLGLRSASRTSTPAYWASWTDSPHHDPPTAPWVADRIVAGLEGGVRTPALGPAVDAARHVLGVEGFVPPSWTELSLGARPPPWEVEDFELGWRWGWQHEAASRVERQHREADILPTLDESASTLSRSQSGPAAGAALSATPSNPATRIDSASGSPVASLALASASCLTHLPVRPSP